MNTGAVCVGEACVHEAGESAWGDDHVLPATDEDLESVAERLVRTRGRTDRKWAGR